MNVFELFATLKLDKSGFDDGLNDAEKSAGSFGSTVSSVAGGALKAGGAALAAAGTAVVAFGKESVDAGMEFDSAMSQVAATMGVSTDQIQNLRTFAQEMGATTAFTATEAAEALNYMALAGYDAETSMSMLPNVLNLAAAGGIDLAYASDMITDSQTALGLSLDETTTLVDEMAKVSSTTNTSVEQLGEAILTIGGTAQFMTGGTEELTQVLGLLADNGIKGSEAGTHLRNMLLKLSSPTENGAAQLEALGVSVFDAEGNMRSFAEIFPDLQESLDGLTSEEQIQALSEIFNTRDVASAQALLSTTAERWDEVAAAIDDAQGSAQKMADTQLDNLAGDVTLFKSALEGAKIAVSDGLTPVLRDFMQIGTEGMSEFTQALQEGDFEGAVDAIGGVMEDGIAAITDLLPEILTLGSQIIDVLIEGVVNNLPSIANGALDIVTTLLTTLANNLPSILESAIQIIITLANGLTQQAPTLVPVILDALMQMVQTLLNNAPEMIGVAVTLITTLAQGIIDYIPDLISRLPELISALVEGVIALAGDMLVAALELIVQLGVGLIEAIPTLIANIPEIIAAIVEGLLEGLGDMAEVGLNLVEGLWNGISDAADWVIGKIKGFGEKILNGIKSFFGINSPSTVFAEIGDFMVQGLGKGWEDNIGDVMDEINDDLDVEGNVEINAGVGTVDTDGLESTSAVGGLQAAGVGDIIIPVYIGQSRLDEVIISNEQIRNYRSGGR